MRAERKLMSNGVRNACGAHQPDLRFLVSLESSLIVAKFELTMSLPRLAFRKSTCNPSHQHCKSTVFGLKRSFASATNATLEHMEADAVSAVAPGSQTPTIVQNAQD